MVDRGLKPWSSQTKAPNDYNITLSVVERGLKPWSSQTKAPNDYNITLSVVDRGLKPWSSQTINFKIGIHCITAKHA